MCSVWSGPTPTWVAMPVHLPMDFSGASLVSTGSSWLPARLLQHIAGGCTGHQLEVCDVAQMQEVTIDVVQALQHVWQESTQVFLYSLSKRAQGLFYMIAKRLRAKNGTRTALWDSSQPQRFEEHPVKPLSVKEVQALWEHMCGPPTDAGSLANLAVAMSELVDGGLLCQDCDGAVHPACTLLLQNDFGADYNNPLNWRKRKFCAEAEAQPEACVDVRVV
jgi:hypothetical protein